MEVLRGIVTVIYVLLCIALIVVVLMQEGKSAGLSGAINGVADTYWGKNKGRSIEGTLEKITKILAALFIIISVVLAMIWLRLLTFARIGQRFCGNHRDKGHTGLSVSLLLFLEFFVHRTGCGNEVGWKIKSRCFTS